MKESLVPAAALVAVPGPRSPVVLRLAATLGVPVPHIMGAFAVAADAFKENGDGGVCPLDADTLAFRVDGDAGIPGFVAAAVACGAILEVQAGTMLTTWADPEAKVVEAVAAATSPEAIDQLVKERRAERMRAYRQKWKSTGKTPKTTSSATPTKVPGRLEPLGVAFTFPGVNGVVHEVERLRNPNDGSEFLRIVAAWVKGGEAKIESKVANCIDANGVIDRVRALRALAQRVAAMEAKGLHAPGDRTVVSPTKGTILAAAAAAEREVAQVAQIEGRDHSVVTRDHSVTTRDHIVTTRGHAPKETPAIPGENIEPYEKERDHAPRTVLTPTTSTLRTYVPGEGEEGEPGPEPEPEPEPGSPGAAQGEPPPVGEQPEARNTEPSRTSVLPPLPYPWSAVPERFHKLVRGIALIERNGRIAEESAVRVSVDQVTINQAVDLGLVRVVERQGSRLVVLGDGRPPSPGGPTAVGDILGGSARV